MQWMKKNMILQLVTGHFLKLQQTRYIVLMGDLNAKIGSNNANREEVMGKFCVGVMNDNVNRERLCDFCIADYGLVITGTSFPHKEIHKLTLRSPDGKTVYRIDHFVVNGRMRTSILDTRVLGRIIARVKTCCDNWNDLSDHALHRNYRA